MECLDMLHTTAEECFILSKLGKVYAKMGETNNAVSSWKKAIETSGNYVLEITSESAWVAYNSGYMDIALDLINNVSTKQSKCSASYLSFLTIADIFSTAGLEEKKKAFYAAARSISRSRTQYCRCLYYEALELQDLEAINRLEKAVDCDADPGLCVDEELSRRWLALAENKEAIGLRSDAKSAALKAVKFYPGENPYKEIEDLL
jgi:tetratricopeptide (TPR) repeat protein